MALTFDDGPRGTCTSGLLDILDPHKAKSTFFQLAHAWGTDCTKPKHFSFCEKLWNRILDNGHTLGYHSWNHNDVPQEPMEKIEDRTGRAEASFARTLGHHPILYRPPNGNTG